MEKIGKCTVTRPESVQTLTFPWGDICLLSEPKASGANALTFASVEVQPGTGHERHSHPNADEIIYVVEGEATQMLDDRKPITITPGTCIFVPRGIYHGTENTGTSVLKLIVVYVPGGEESVLRNLPGVTIKDPVTKPFRQGYSDCAEDTKNPSKLARVGDGHTIEKTFN